MKNIILFCCFICFVFSLSAQKLQEGAVLKEQKLHDSGTYADTYFVRTTDSKEVFHMTTRRGIKEYGDVYISRFSTGLKKEKEAKVVLKHEGIELRTAQVFEFHNHLYALALKKAKGENMIAPYIQEIDKKNLQATGKLISLPVFMASPNYLTAIKKGTSLTWLRTYLHYTKSENEKAIVFRIINDYDVDFTNIITIRKTKSKDKLLRTHRIIVYNQEMDLLWERTEKAAAKGHLSISDKGDVYKVFNHNKITKLVAWRKQGKETIEVTPTGTDIHFLYPSLASLNSSKIKFIGFSYNDHSPSGTICVSNDSTTLEVLENKKQLFNEDQQTAFLNKYEKKTLEKKGKLNDTMRFFSGINIVEIRNDGYILSCSRAKYVNNTVIVRLDLHGNIKWTSIINNGDLEHTDLSHLIVPFKDHVDVFYNHYKGKTIMKTSINSEGISATSPWVSYKDTNNVQYDFAVAKMDDNSIILRGINMKVLKLCFAYIVY